MAHADELDVLPQQSTSTFLAPGSIRQPFQGKVEVEAAPLMLLALVSAHSARLLRYAVSTFFSLFFSKPRSNPCLFFFTSSRVAALILPKHSGVIQFISLAFGIALSFFPDEYDRAANIWKYGGADRIESDASHWPTDRSREIIAVNCHSHNDYWRKVPLFSALQAGCVGVEADVWLFDDELYVGHTTSSLTSRRTLRSLYIDPLVEILNQQNPATPFRRILDTPARGVFDADPGQSVVLLIDFKTDGATTWPAVAEELAPLRDRG